MDLEKIIILHNFAEKLLSGSEDLEPSIVELVNKNFWDLICVEALQEAIKSKKAK